MMWFLLISFCFNAEEIKIHEIFFFNKKARMQACSQFSGKKKLSLYDNIGILL